MSHVTRKTFAGWEIKEKTIKIIKGKAPGKESPGREHDILPAKTQARKANHMKSLKKRGD